MPSARHSLTHRQERGSRVVEREENRYRERWQWDPQGGWCGTPQERLGPWPQCTGQAGTRTGRPNIPVLGSQASCAHISLSSCQFCCPLPQGEGTKRQMENETIPNPRSPSKPLLTFQPRTPPHTYTTPFPQSAVSLLASPLCLKQTASTSGSWHWPSLFLEWPFFSQCLVKCPLLGEVLPFWFPFLLQFSPGHFSLSDTLCVLSVWSISHTAIILLKRQGFLFCP
jgi:hypothetical protein